MKKFWQRVSRLGRVKALIVAMIMVVALSVPQSNVFAASAKKPKLVSATAKTSTSITVKWKKASGAKGYIIYQKSGSGKYKKVATVSGGSKVKYTKKGLKSATKYSYKVKSYTSKKKSSTYSSYSNAKSTYTLPSTPKVSVKALSEKQIQVSWKKVSKAKGYEVYQIIGGKSKKIATLTSGSKVSYTVNNLIPATNYTFYVRAYAKLGGKKIYSANSKTYNIATNPHTLKNYKCISCGKIVDAYKYLEAWLMENGTVDGSYVSASEFIIDTSYGLRYDASDDSLYVSSGYENSYGDFVWTYIKLDSLVYFQCVGEYLYDDYVGGTLNGKTFTANSPLAYTSMRYTYYNSSSLVESTRANVCDILDWFKNFLVEENVGITLYDLGFIAY